MVAARAMQQSQSDIETILEKEYQGLVAANASKEEIHDFKVKIHSRMHQLRKEQQKAFQQLGLLSFMETSDEDKIMAQMWELAPFVNALKQSASN